jgi:hypothetical protein
MERHDGGAVSNQRVAEVYENPNPHQRRVSARSFISTYLPGFGLMPYGAFNGISPPSAAGGKAIQRRRESTKA